MSCSTANNAATAGGANVGRKEGRDERVIACTTRSLVLDETRGERGERASERATEKKRERERRTARRRRRRDRVSEEGLLARGLETPLSEMDPGMSVDLARLVASERDERGARAKKTKKTRCWARVSWKWDREACQL